MNQRTEEIQQITKIKSKEDGLLHEDLVKLTEYLKRQNQKLQVQAIDVRGVDDFGEMVSRNVAAYGGLGPSFDNQNIGLSLMNVRASI